MNRVSILAAIGSCLVLMSGCNQNSSQASRELKRLFDDEWEFTMKESPLFATHCGDHRFNDRLPDISEAAEQRHFAQRHNFLERLKSINISKLTASEQLNYDIFKREIENSMEWHKFQTYLMPINHMWGFHTSFPELPDHIPLNNVKDYKNYIARLNGFKHYAQQHIELMRTGIERGFVLPKVVLGGVEDSIEAHIVDDAAKSLLYKPFEEFPETINEAEQKCLAEAGKLAIMNSVVPGYDAFLKFMAEEYIPSARDDIAILSLPNGKALYEHCVRSYTTLDVTPQQVHNIGLAEVERIKSEMAKVIAKTGFDGDLDDFEQFLSTDERFYADTAKELLKETAFIVKKVEGKLPKFFKVLPRIPFGIKEVPEYIAAQRPGAYYRSPTGDGTHAGLYYINTHDLKHRPLYTLAVLSLHETVPGHHLQIALQQELEDVPNFRRHYGFTVYTEGWAFYAERLGVDMDVYEDLYSEFGRLIFEMWRACRLVVDTGMHYMGWSREQAIDFMDENTTIRRKAITVEVDRYIVWPGQALAYKIGQLKILELRSLAKEQLGEKFSLREFHNVVLSDGSVPLDVLEKKVKRWLAKNTK